MRTVIHGTPMDGHCRDMLTSAFDRFLSMEKRRLSKRLLTRVRGQRERIAAIVTLMSELDQLDETETDRSVFAEMALLFDEISLTAVAGVVGAARDRPGQGRDRPRRPSRAGRSRHRAMVAGLRGAEMLSARFQRCFIPPAATPLRGRAG